MGCKTDDPTSTSNSFKQFKSLSKVEEELISHGHRAQASKPL